MDRNHIRALEFWVTQSVPERKKILAALEADESLADHDFAALPPQVQSGVNAGLAPPAEPAETETDTDTETHGRGRRKRGDD